MAGSVQRVTDWAAEGLLDGLEGDARSDRAQLLDELHDGGVGVDELRRAVAEDRLALLPVERLLMGEPRYTIAELAQEAGLSDESLVLAFRRAQGLATPAPDERAYTEEDLEDARRARVLLDTGLSAEDLVAVERVLGQGMARYADAFRFAFAQALLQPGDSEADVARRYAAAFELMAPQAAPHLAHVFFLHLRELVRSDVVSAEERREGRLHPRDETTVAFADLVGFTKLGETVGHEELGGVANRLTELATDTVSAPVRIVKTIGDAVMLVSPEPAPMMSAVLDMVDATEPAGLPQLRAGVALGPAVNRWGDWYGSTVNLASRLTTRARPSSVLATEAVKDAVADGLVWSAAGEKKLKGFSAPVRAYRARRAA